MRVHEINPETTMFSSAVPIPMIGVLPINAYLIRGEQPTLVDTGISPEQTEFDAALRDAINPADLRWIVLTHADRDHTGGISRLLTQAPDARVVTGFLTVGIMSVGTDPIPPERALLVRDGSAVDIGDRTLTVKRPPLFDNPGTLAFFDPKQSILFSSDCFGAPFETEDGALADDVAGVPRDQVQSGQTLWGSVDSPWVHFVERARIAENFARFVDDRPEHVLSSHLPPINGDLDRHVATLTDLPNSAPYVAPDQEALAAFMAQMHQ
jgi:glyoxylase-like metal-dependent hydrolase (beta-lactamase superfamily II)